MLCAIIDRPRKQHMYVLNGCAVLAVRFWLDSVSKHVSFCGKNSPDKWWLALDCVIGLRQSDSSGSPRQSLSQDIGTPLWDFACAVQRLSSFPLGAQKDAFWDEVVHASWQITRVLRSLVFRSICIWLDFQGIEIQNSWATIKPLDCHLREVNKMAHKPVAYDFTDAV